MTDLARPGPVSTRRQLLAGVGVATAALAGCSGDAGGSETTPTAGDGEGPTTPTPTPTPVGELLSPPVTGNADAAVTLTVFEDYACPHCADYNAEGFPELDGAYVSPGEIRYEHRDLPIPVVDPGSFRAANAARAVQHRYGDEAFWSYSRALFERSGDIGSRTPGLFETLADERGQDGGSIRSAAVNRRYRRTVDRDRQRAVDLGAEATPTFVVNGEIVASGFGSDTLGTVRGALDEALSETG
jgi:protein-disulfide isomerase